MQGPGSQGCSREGPQGSGFTWPRVPRGALRVGEAASAAAMQPLVPRAAHTWLPLPHFPGTSRSSQQPLEVTILTALAREDLSVHVHSPSLLLWCRCPSFLHRESSSHPRPPALAPAAPLLALPAMPPSQSPPTRTHGPSSHLSQAAHHLTQVPLVPPSFSHLHLYPVDPSWILVMGPDCQVFNSQTRTSPTALWKVRNSKTGLFS